MTPSPLQLSIHPLAKGQTFTDWQSKLPRARLVDAAAEKAWWAALHLAQAQAGKKGKG